MRTMVLKAAVAMTAALLAACSSLPQQAAVAQPPASVYLAHLERIKPITNFAMTGRMAILTDAKGFSGSMHWHHHEEGEDIQFYSPLGTQLGNLSKNAEGVTLTTSNQKTYSAADAETLTQQTLGWGLPLDGLSDWMLGRPAEGDVEVLAWDAAGNITRMRQQGWELEYPVYVVSEGVSLPSKVLLKSNKLELKLVVEQWQTGQPE